MRKASAWSRIRLIIDVTVSCPLLPSHVRAAASDAAAIFRARAAEKDAKHLPGCVDLGRAFLAVVFTTLGGVGPAPAREWLDGLFAASYAAELLDGGTGSRTAHRRLCLVFVALLWRGSRRSSWAQTPWAIRSQHER